MAFLRAYLVALLAMALLDAIWLGGIASGFYRRELGPLMADSVRLWPAALFYLLYPLALVCFGRPQMQSAMLPAALRCAALGAFAYGTYDLSNLATLRGWPAWLSVIDIAWGSLASGVAGALAQRLSPATARRANEAG